MRVTKWLRSYSFIILIISLAYLLTRQIFLFGRRAAGNYLIQKSLKRKSALLAEIRSQEGRETTETRSSPRSDDGDWEKVESGSEPTGRDGKKARSDWDGIIGFLHPFCNAGGGGERVLWEAIAATQKQWPKATCVVYTGDEDASKAAILQRVENRFNIYLSHSHVIFIYLRTRHYVLSSAYPHFTLLGQSLGSLVLAYDAFSLLVPDVFVDTMGYAFSLAFAKWLFPTMPTAAYVHYPTISTDMLGSLNAHTEDGLNAGAGKGWKGGLKRQYWLLFAWMYGWVGSHVDVVMTNSSWTQAHIRALWGPWRARRNMRWEPEVVFPPVAVGEIEKAIEISESSEAQREPILLYIAQFRPEKNQALVLRAFAQMVRSWVDSGEAKSKPPKLVLLGSVRDRDDEERVNDLVALAEEMKVQDQVEFIRDATWPEILGWLRKSSVGVNGMWNEHFGIGVVEYQAAGLICVVNNSGGPKEDIVIDYQGGPTGFHAASTIPAYALQFAHALSLPAHTRLEMRRRARASARRFSEEVFAEAWIGMVGRLVG